MKTWCLVMLVPALWVAYAYGLIVFEKFVPASASGEYSLFAVTGTLAVPIVGVVIADMLSGASGALARMPWPVYSGFMFALILAYLWISAVAREVFSVFLSFPTIWTGLAAGQMLVAVLMLYPAITGWPLKRQIPAAD